jgi:gamma-glutamyltranspeptidase/glutathione hydrolase
MVVSSQADAARAGVEILAAGGNAVDAAVAVAWAVGVTQPFSAGVGGGAFILIRTAAGEVVAIDAREIAPAAATRDMYAREGVPEKASLHGPLAVAVPSLVQGLELVRERWGTLPRERLMAPAIRLAEDGFVIGRYHARLLSRMRTLLSQQRFAETARIQLAPFAGSERPGGRLVQKDLARSLRLIAKQGAAVMQEGELARAIVTHVQNAGGLLSLSDLRDYRPRLREAVRGHYRGIEVLSFPPPSSGGAVLIECLNILEGFDLASEGAGSSQSMHLVSEAMKLAFADRASLMGDPDFVSVPLDRLVSKAHGEAQRARIDPARAGVVAAPGAAREDAGTTHLSVSDAAGNMVALTMTINTPFGSGLTVPGTGIMLNNEMDDFAVAPDSPNAYGLVDTSGANAVAPGKRPLSSMTPTILVKDGRPWMASGSPGGPRIISTTLLSIVNVVDWGMDAQAAVSAPRFHHQWQPDVLRVEPEVARDVVESLRARGHVVEVERQHWSAAEVIVIDAKTGLHWGGSDPRTDGAAMGLAP